MVKYKLTSDGVQDKEIGASIPANPTNRDWRKFLKWKKKPGNNPDPEFTEEELAVQKQSKIRNIERTIADTRVRKDAANAEGLFGLESDCQTELDKLRTELIAEQGT